MRAAFVPLGAGEALCAPGRESGCPESAMAELSCPEDSQGPEAEAGEEEDVDGRASAQTKRGECWTPAIDDEENSSGQVTPDLGLHSGPV